MSYYYIEVIPEPEERNVERNEDRQKLANFLTTFFVDSMYTKLYLSLIS